MGRSRVLSFISAFGGSSRRESPEQHNRTASASKTLSSPPSRVDTPSTDTPSPLNASPRGPPVGERRMSRPGSTIFSHNPPLMALSQDTPAELQPIFSFLNSHTNKLYLEGYFLKLNDLDTNGRPCLDRQWVECYAQLVGTVLSLWDAAALDAAGEGQEVPPTFINLSDASIKMIETLPTRNDGMQTLKNVLSICSAGQNRYLLHFNSFHSLTQWTAAIRLALFEHTSLYEAYTGSMIAGKGKHLNNIRAILERSRFVHEDWARVRFGAGTPWRRCWFVITPPDEKELKKAQKSMKKSAYDRAPRLVTGDIKFFDTKKTKKAKPIATIKDAYCAYAIYPESKALIDQSTLVKIEGRVTIHSQPESTSEGFVFVMPETHPAVSGFEIMIRFLMPTFDTFNLYGRPTRLIAATNHVKSIMFAFPNERRYGYLDIMDIAHLMQAPGSHTWSEAEWRKQLKEATARRMAATGGSRSSSISGSRPKFRASLPNRYSTVPNGIPQRPFPESQPGFNQSSDAIIHEVPKDDDPFSSPVYHTRGASDTAGFSTVNKHPENSVTEVSPASSDQDLAQPARPETNGLSDHSSSDSEYRAQESPETETIGQQFRSPSPPAPVSLPPAFTHGPGDLPHARPQPSPDLRKANHRMSNATLTQLAAASGKLNLPGANAFEHDEIKEHPEPGPQEPTSPSFYSAASDTAAFSDSRPGSNDRRAVPEDQVPAPFDPRSSTFGGPLPKLNRQSVLVDTTKATKRKPVASQEFRNPVLSPTNEPSEEDLRHTVDEDALKWVGAHQPIPSPSKEDPQDEESVYDDASATSPDYASTHGSIYSKRSVKSIPKPRMGVKKTVGVEPQKDLVIGDAHYSLDRPNQRNPDIPSVDFGPTMTYLPTTGRPNTSDTFKKGHQRTDSDATERQRFSVPTHPMDRARSGSPSQEEYRRSVLWQPGMASGRPVTPGGLTPEQFVQQRAAHSPQLHAHHRSPSTTPTLTPARPVSGDWMAHQRQSSRDVQPRPHSRGAASMMNYNDISSHLSAREQEHVARMTGSSFFNMSNENKKPQPQVNPMGLVGAIDARERERKEFKDGVSNQMVQHAIAQRQQHWQQHQVAPPPSAPAYAAQDGRYNGVYNMPTASHTWDAFNQPYQPDEPRRRSWYGQLSPQQQPLAYQQSQYFSQHPGHFTNGNAMHY